VGAPGSPAVSGVVSIRAHSSYRPDYRKLASVQFAAARQKLGLTQAQFAEMLSDMLGWPVLESAVKRWETVKDPLASVLAAAKDAAGGEAGVAALPLITEPPAFPAEALAGPWVTSYQFMHAGKPHHHADIAHVVTGSGNRIRAVNHPPEPRSEGRGRAFRNEINGELNGRHVGGVWVNTSDTRYWGRFQLAVLPGEIVMEGWFGGVGSDIEVSTGFWKWVRLDAGPVPPAGFTLRDPSELYDLVMNHSQYGEPLTLADVRGEP
jgi:hypothetical protein